VSPEAGSALSPLMKRPYSRVATAIAWTLASFRRRPGGH
jgi:hypothetical protein